MSESTGIKIITATSQTTAREPSKWKAKTAASILFSFGFSTNQRAKKVVSDSPKLVDFAVGVVNSVLNLPNGQLNFFGGNSNSRITLINPAHQIFLRLVEMTLGQVHASCHSLPEWQAVKLTSFAPCKHSLNPTYIN